MKKHPPAPTRLDSIIRQISPSWAFRRARARIQHDLISDFKPATRRTFEAVSKNRTRYDFKSTSASADSAIAGDQAALREHVRQLEYDNGQVAGPIRRIVNHVIGRGIMMRSTVAPDPPEAGTIIPRIDHVTAERFSFWAERFMDQWSKHADMRLIHSFYGLQRLACSALFGRDGETLLIGRISTRRDRLIPYCLELLETDRLRTPFSEIKNPKIRSGIEYDDEGVPKTYFILKRHPGESFIAAMKREDFEEVPAFFENGQKKVLYLYDPVRPEQTRGYSQFAAGLTDMQDAERYKEAEKFAALMAACTVAAIKTKSPNDFSSYFGDTPTAGAGEEGSGGAGYQRRYDFAPGELWNLAENEEIEFNDPKRPNTGFGEYMYNLYQGPANAIDIPPEVLTQNWRNLNYSNARTILLWFYGSCWIRQDYIINHLCRPVYENVVSWLIAKGLFQKNGVRPPWLQRKEDLLKSSWVPQVYRRWVDPAREANGRQTDLANNIETLTDTCAEQGKDIDEHLNKRARELKKMKDLEEAYGIKFPGPAKTAQASEPNADANEDTEDERKKRSLSVVRG
jgi:lambda family phage portal protein